MESEEQHSLANAFSCQLDKEFVNWVCAKVRQAAPNVYLDASEMSFDRCYYFLCGNLEKMEVLCEDNKSRLESKFICCGRRLTENQITFLAHYAEKRRSENIEDLVWYICRMGQALHGLRILSSGQHQLYFTPSAPQLPSLLFDVNAIMDLSRNILVVRPSVEEAEFVPCSRDDAHLMIQCVTKKQFSKIVPEYGTLGKQITHVILIYFANAKYWVPLSRKGYSALAETFPEYDFSDPLYCRTQDNALATRFLQWPKK